MIISLLFKTLPEPNNRPPQSWKRTTGNNLYNPTKTKFLHNDRRIRNGKMCAVWPYHSESHSYGCLNNAHKLIWLWCARNNELLSSFCFVSGNTLRVNLCRPKNFVLSILCLTWLTHAISHALFQLSKDHDRTIFAFKNATKN